MSPPLLQRPGAVALDVEGGGSVAAHYGEPLPEQRRIAPDHTIDLRTISELAVADLAVRTPPR